MSFCYSATCEHQPCKAAPYCDRCDASCLGEPFSACDHVPQVEQPYTPDPEPEYYERKGRVLCVPCFMDQVYDGAPSGE